MPETMPETMPEKMPETTKGREAGPGPEILTFGCRLNIYESEVMRRHADLFNGKVQATPEMMADIIYSAVKRNYPDMSRDEFEENHLDLGNMNQAFAIVMNLSGAEKTEGEALPGNP